MSSKMGIWCCQAMVPMCSAVRPSTPSTSGRSIAPDDTDVRADEEVPEPDRFRGSHGDGMSAGACDELVDRGVGDQSASTDDDQTCCCLGHFAHQVG